MRKAKKPSLIAHVQLLEGRVPLQCLGQLHSTLVSDPINCAGKNDIGGEGAKKLVEALQENSTLKELYLDD